MNSLFSLETKNRSQNSSFSWETQNRTHNSSFPSETATENNPFQAKKKWNSRRNLVIAQRNHSVQALAILCLFYRRFEADMANQSTCLALMKSTAKAQGFQSLFREQPVNCVEGSENYYYIYKGSQIQFIWNLSVTTRDERANR